MTFSTILKTVNFSIIILYLSVCSSAENTTKKKGSLFLPDIDTHTEKQISGSLDSTVRIAPVDRQNNTYVNSMRAVKMVHNTLLQRLCCGEYEHADVKYSSRKPLHKAILHNQLSSTLYSMIDEITHTLIATEDSPETIHAIKELKNVLHTSTLPYYLKKTVDNDNRWKISFIHKIYYYTLLESLDRLYTYRFWVSLSLTIFVWFIMRSACKVPECIDIALFLPGLLLNDRMPLLSSWHAYLIKKYNIFDSIIEESIEILFTTVATYPYEQNFTSAITTLWTE